ncbi:MAG: uncharacterized membrane protein (UPF0127 family) [Natronomonas sp.]|jgi:uncharacterized membrane protein (UPF0127 family)
MNARQAVSGALLLAAGVVLLLTLAPGLLVGDPGSYERTTVTATDANGTALATVEVRVADTQTKRRVGLSETDSLGPDEGMLFVHETEAVHPFVMAGPREDMSFPLDIVFIDANGTVTTVHHAAVDAAGRFEGRAKYVLEVERGWANRTGLGVGDTVEIPPGLRAR